MFSFVLKNTIRLVDPIPKKRKRWICVKQICFYIDSPHNNKKKRQHNQLPPATEIKTNQRNNVRSKKRQMLVVYVLQLAYLKRDINRSFQ